MTGKRLIAPRTTAANRRRVAVFQKLFGPFCILVDFLVILGAAVVAGIAWHLAVYGKLGPIALHVRIGESVALLFVAITVLRNDYRFSVYISSLSQGGRLLYVWNATFFLLFTLAFLTRTIDPHPYDR